MQGLVSTPFRICGTEDKTTRSRYPILKTSSSKAVGPAFAQDFLGQFTSILVVYDLGYRLRGLFRAKPCRARREAPRSAYFRARKPPTTFGPSSIRNTNALRPINHPRAISINFLLCLGKCAQAFVSWIRNPCDTRAEAVNMFIEGGPDFLPHGIEDEVNALPPRELRGRHEIAIPCN